MKHIETKTTAQRDGYRKVTIHCLICKAKKVLYSYGNLAGQRYGIHLSDKDRADFKREHEHPENS